MRCKCLKVRCLCPTNRDSAQANLYPFGLRSVAFSVGEKRTAEATTGDVKIKRRKQSKAALAKVRSMVTLKDMTSGRTEELTAGVFLLLLMLDETAGCCRRKGRARSTAR